MFENSSTVDIKSVITEHSETLNKFPKIIGKGKKVVSNNSLYSDKKVSENFLNKKNIKSTNPAHAFKGYASPYNIEILNSFNLEVLEP